MILKERIIGLCTKLKEKTPKVIVDSVDYILDEVKFILNEWNIENLIKYLVDGNYNDFEKTTSKMNLSERSIKKIAILAIQNMLWIYKFSDVYELIQDFEISEEDYKKVKNEVYSLKTKSLKKDIKDFEAEIKNEKDRDNKKYLEEELITCKELLEKCEEILNHEYVLSKKIN